MRQEEKILRGKSLNSGAGVLSGESSSFGAGGGEENKTQEEEEEEKIERVTEMGCDSVSFGLVKTARTMSEYEGSWRKERHWGGSGG